MSPYQSHLLYTKQQKDAFRAKYGQLVDASLQKFEDWFYTLPLYEWAPVAGIRPATAEFQIGMICMLMWTDRANFCIDFPEDGGVIIQRYARDRAEFDEYIKTHFVKPSKIQMR